MLQVRGTGRSAGEIPKIQTPSVTFPSLWLYDLSTTKSNIVHKSLMDMSATGG